MLWKAQGQPGHEDEPPGGRGRLPRGPASGRPVGRRLSRALDAVPREAFATGAASGSALVSGAAVSAEEGGPTAGATDLAQLTAALGRLCPLTGQSVLEVGTGSGFVAALLAEMVGPSGHVVTMDLDGTRAVNARLNLARAGYGRVDVVGADGTYGFAPEAPYDRILVRGCTPLVTRQWVEQLQQGGRLVVPLDLQGVQVLAALRRDGSEVRSRWLEPAAWGPLDGGPTVEARGLRVEAGGWLARSAELGPDDRGPLATLLGYSPVLQAGVAMLLPADGWPFLLFLALRDPRAVLLQRAGEEPAGTALDGVALFDPEEGSMVAAVAAQDGSGRLDAWTFGRTDMLAALEHYARAWQPLNGAQPLVLAAPLPDGGRAEGSDPRTPCQLSVVWQ